MALGVLALVSVVVVASRVSKDPARVPARAQPPRTTAAAGQIEGVVAAVPPGSPEDLWLKRLSLELRLLGFDALPHHTPAALAGVPIPTSAALNRDRTRLDIYVFGSAEQAESAALGLRLQPAAHEAERDGRVAIRRKDRVVLDERVDQGVVDNFEFEDVLTLAARQPPLTSDDPVSGPPRPASSGGGAPERS